RVHALAAGRSRRVAARVGGLWIVHIEGEVSLRVWVCAFHVCGLRRLSNVNARAGCPVGLIGIGGSAVGRRRLIALAEDWIGIGRRRVSSCLAARRLTVGCPM